MGLSPLRSTAFWKHYAAMVAAMFLGMLALMPVLHGAPDGLREDLEQPVPLSLFMATTMAVGMTVYMAWRRHSWVSIIAMDAVMYASFVVLFPLFWAGLLGGEGLLTVGHVLMLPAMVAVMLLVPGHATHAHHAHPAAASKVRT